MSNIEGVFLIGNFAQIVNFLTVFFLYIIVKNRKTKNYDKLTM